MAHTDKLAGKLLLNVNEAVAATGIGRSSLYELMRVGELPVVKIFSRTYFRPSDLEAFVERRLVRPVERKAA
ncbi:transcriptional regulator, AlpA family [Mesorhizobium albiziae]|uniref:Transcriptional regulator, AlpA family n=1 Tax=Neomesorhizobium albiziae TaxID=335020 RepID=A0A1I3XC05_9HYPH|nr:helix-turn-helix domain-containing protein [Mesorhizobium albiziae]GLS30562.1 hypothetical protein GCM10007937_22700 [Mesorhizobium albiziae]SFK16997.1 transcriptional regulator, AlpA family [Mesorhizobium albiziae]